MSATPIADPRSSRDVTDDKLLVVNNLTQEFVVRATSGVKGGVVHAVSDVSFAVRRGETLGIVGETGAGKSTVARAVMQAPRPQSGEVILDGVDLAGLSGTELRAARRNMQMVFQDPYSSLDTKWRVRKIVQEPLVGFGVGSASERSRKANEILDLVGLNPSLFGSRHPRELSGGQCQRVAIARALTIAPELLVCDEVVSALDVLIQAQILNLFEELRKELQLSYLFISHDLSVIKQVSDRVAVMYLGKICEVASTERLFSSPAHPYTAALLASNPSTDPRKRGSTTMRMVASDPPSPIDPPSGCRFRTRCPYATELCASEEPPLRALGRGQAVACHFPLVAAEPIEAALP